VERKEWNRNYDRLCGGEWRRERYAQNKRYGLAVTDCVFMSSRDNKSWYRFDEATVEIGPEVYTNWVYGSCYPASGGVLETPSRFDGEPNELSIYVRDRRHDDPMAGVITRHTYRMDGFASYKAPYAKKTLRTKPFTFEGSELEINFSSSAFGDVTVTVCDGTGNELDGYKSIKIFGDSVSRKVRFEKDLKLLENSPIRLKFELHDTDLYSFKFN
jgi:hypothetical protein